ncbi:MAG: bifunctional riboflavin kinase/FAD synthetase [Acetatifactor sp.]|nr:bifunctional riboflavin kinase/FAD synthetase [Acetatifactor sp.]
MTLEIIADSLDFQLNRDTAIAIGKFDGVHLGHRRLLEEILAKKQDGLEACVFTFDISPSVLFGLSDGKVLTTREEKRRIFREMGVDVLVEFPMTLETAAIEPEDFARRFLSDALGCRFIAAGDDLSFGRYGRGNAALLQSLAEELSFEVKTIAKVQIDGTPVSSTYIRSLVEAGEMEEAARFLGESYCVDGKVVHGNHFGHSLGFPTMNLIPSEDKLLPPFGVYASKVRIENKLYKAITNVGLKPTVTGGKPAGEDGQSTSKNERMHAGVETHLLDYDCDLYGHEVQVFLHHFQRPEQKFESIDALKAQIARDVEACR